mmetsp:Transcript_2938/g.4981  ORF Transcript_2938/g.4981 Transcript_2938/m.4981 type:complete len:88 (+) Transcript_2938:112-375(+)
MARVMAEAQVTVQVAPLVVRAALVATLEAPGAKVGWASEAGGEGGLEVEWVVELGKHQGGKENSHNAHTKIQAGGNTTLHNFVFYYR